MRLGLCLFFLITFFACRNDETLPLCNSEDPVNNLSWLKRTTADIQSNPNDVSVVISVFDYKGQTIFNIYDMISSCAYCDLRDCSGQKYAPSDFNDLIANKKNERRIWCQDPDLCVN
jgi:hypothetical protein